MSLYIVKVHNVNKESEIYAAITRSTKVYIYMYIQHVFFMQTLKRSHAYMHQLKNLKIIELQQCFKTF